MKMIGGYALLVLMLFVRAMQGPATYYTATTGGDDTRSCTVAKNISTPKKTIGSGLGCLSLGDTLLVRAGTYPESIFLTQPSGTTVKAYPGETPVMMGDITWALENNLVWDGITIDDSTSSSDISDCIIINSGDHITVQNAELRNCQRHGILTGDGNGAPIGYLNFNHLNVHNTGQGYLTSGDPRHHNFYISAHNFNTIGTIVLDHIESHNEGNPANQGSGGPSGSAENSWGIQVYNFDSPGFLNNVILSNNYVHDNNQGIVIGSGHDLYAFNNVVANNNNHAGAGCEAGITVGYNSVNVNNIQIYNNTIYGNRGQNQASLGFDCTGQVYGISVGTFGNPTNTIIRNNILWQNDIDAVNLAGGSGTVISNQFAGQNPLFVNPGAGDFHLQAASLARLIGLNLSSIFTTDKDGNTRPPVGAWDNGAYQLFVPSAPTPTVLTFTAKSQ